MVRAPRRSALAKKRLMRVSVMDTAPCARARSRGSRRLRRDAALRVGRERRAAELVLLERQRDRRARSLEERLAEKQMIVLRLAVRRGTVGLLAGISSD